MRGSWGWWLCQLPSSKAFMPKLLQCVFFILLLASAGCHKQEVIDAPKAEIEAAVEKAKEEIRNELAVMPAWYRASLVPSYSFEEKKDTASLVIISYTIITKKAIPDVKEPLFWPCLGLSLFVYVVFIPVTLWFVINKECSGNWEDSHVAGLVFGTLGCVVAIYIVVAILALLVVGIARVGFQVAYAKPYFLYYSFSYIAVNAFIVCVMVVVSLSALASMISGRPMISTTTAQGQSSANTRWVLGSMLKAAILFILTGIGSHIAGVIGAGIVFVIMTGVSALFGMNLVHQKSD